MWGQSDINGKNFTIPKKQPFSLNTKFKEKIIMDMGYGKSKYITMFDGLL